jgi:hypothetical protein
MNGKTKKLQINSIYIYDMFVRVKLIACLATMNGTIQGALYGDGSRPLGPFLVSTLISIHPLCEGTPLTIKPWSG